ncbi:MAG TPA: universal stress protein [Vicinamibacterales bacterium]
MTPFRTIVVATDFSETAREALRTALEISRTSGAHLHIVNVVPDPMQQPWMVEAAGVDWANLRKEWMDASRAQMEELMRTMQLREGEVVTVVVPGRPAHELVSYAERHGADLIVMGTHGYGAVRRFLLGSVADQVLRQATCPVLVVPHRAVKEQAGSGAAEASAVR